MDKEAQQQIGRSFGNLATSEITCGNYKEAGYSLARFTIPDTNVQLRAHGDKFGIAFWWQLDSGMSWR